jgi:hypothetical protein
MREADLQPPAAWISFGGFHRPGLELDAKETHSALHFEHWNRTKVVFCSPYGSVEAMGFQL